ncbi:MAG TPA: Rieske 2Fe-2S domain-containing protein [Spongiibacteraceae bacterium]|nr:Rieske 2Fe-2S domain-containing protein [Spongiibacteraceae bacterium]
MTAATAAATDHTYPPYKIEAAAVPERYARGWHCLGKASDFTAEPRRLQYFGTKLVAYRGSEDNTVHILDGYCPHMGADLALGCVEGNSIVCPFHAWSWGGDGICDDIPYAKRIPLKAVIKSWPIMEENGLLFVWNDPEGNPPIAAQRPLRSADYFSGEWTDWVTTQFTIHSNCRELVDNMADVAHFGPVHYFKINKFRNVQDGHRYTQYSEGSHAILEDGSSGLTSVAIYEGPAYMTTTMNGSMDGKAMEVHLLVAHVPLNTECFHINFGVMLKKVAGVSAEENQKLLEEYLQANIISFKQDVDVWDNKVRVDNPLLCDGDGPLHMLRKWYSQFYMNVADIPQDIVKPKEHITLA